MYIRNCKISEFFYFVIDNNNLSFTL